MFERGPCRCGYFPDRECSALLRQLLTPAENCCEQHNDVAEEKPSPKERRGVGPDVRKNAREPDCAECVQKHAGGYQDDRRERAFLSGYSGLKDSSRYPHHHWEADQEKQQRGSGRCGAKDILAREA